MALTDDYGFVVADCEEPGAINSIHFRIDATAIACPASGEAFHGQDAQYDGYPPVFSISADELTVDDATTGLTWQRSPDTNGDGTASFTFAPSFLQAGLYGVRFEANDGIDYDRELVLFQVFDIKLQLGDSVQLRFNPGRSFPDTTLAVDLGPHAGGQDQ